MLHMSKYLVHFTIAITQVVATHFTFTDPQDLEPGQTAPFEIIVYAPTINEITFASLNVGSSQYSSINNNQTTHVIQNINSSSSSFQSPIVNSMPQYSPYQQQQQQQLQQQPYPYLPPNPNTQPYTPYVPTPPQLPSSPLFPSIPPDQSNN